MIAHAHSATLAGIDALPVTVEVDLRSGTPFYALVGLADKAVQESTERVRSALINSDLSFPFCRTTVNLAPGDIRKEGPMMDLPIAVGLLAASGQVAREWLDDTVLVGELGLDGNLRPIDGAVSVALMCRQLGFKRLILPAGNAAEAAVAPDIEVYGLEKLLDVAELLNGSLAFQPFKHADAAGVQAPRYEVDFADVKGQRHAVRALEIAAAGGHNVLMVGPPGSGKTMLARRVPTILPPLSLEESIEVTRIYSAGREKNGREGLIWERPFRAPHHTSSYAALVGGGKNPKPGEVSFGHYGVLFLDEMPEFDRGVLEALRQPLEDGVVTVSRVQASITFPAESILIGAMNPCPCGYKGTDQRCTCPAHMVEKYAAKISGPLLDRIDLQITVPKLKPEELINQPEGEPSEAIRERVTRAREVQWKRFGSRSKVNAKMTPREIKEMVVLDDECKEFMRLVASRLNLSARVFDRLLKVGRTIADLAGCERVQKAHLSEAVQHRSQSRN